MLVVPGMGLLGNIVQFLVFKTCQVVWTTYTIGLLILGRFKYGKGFFKKVERQKPKCLEGWNEGYLQLDSIRMHYVQTGKDDAPLLLMLHGYPEFWYSWRYQLRHFEKKYRCVAVDMRGYNLTDKPSGVSNYQVSLLANDVNQVIEKLGYKKAYLMAHDWGAAVAWRTAQMFPDHIEKLVILNVPHPSAFSSAGLEQLYKSWYMFLFQTPWIPELSVSAGDFHMFDLMFLGNKAGIRNKKNFTKEDLEAWKYVFGQPGALTPPINYYRCLSDNQPVRGDDKIVKPPTLIVWGTGDLFLSKTGAENSVQYCRNAKLKFIEGASHWVMQDEPELVNKYVEEFLGEGEARSVAETEDALSRPDSPASSSKL